MGHRVKRKTGEPGDWSAVWALETKGGGGGGESFKQLREYLSSLPRTVYIIKEKEKKKEERKDSNVE